jgi:hypothetical protein
MTDASFARMELLRVMITPHTPISGIPRRVRRSLMLVNHMNLGLSGAERRKLTSFIAVPLYLRIPASFAQTAPRQVMISLHTPMAGIPQHVRRLLMLPNTSELGQNRADGLKNTS